MPTDTPYLAAGSPPPPGDYDADIVILTMGRQQATLAAIASALRQQTLSFYIAVLDQGGDPAAQRRYIKLFQSCPHAGYYVAAHNLGVAGGRNFLSAIGHGRIIVSLDNDAVFADGFIASDALRAFAAAPHLGAIAFRIMDESGQALDERSWGYPESLKPRAHGRFLTTTFVGAGHAIRRDAWEDAGGYDESLFFTWEEYDFALRAICRHWHVEYRGELAVRHRADEEARVRWQNGRTAIFVRNRILIARKWGSSWLGLTPRIGAYLVQGALNGAFLAAASGVSAAWRMDDWHSHRKMPPAMRLYLEENEERHRGTWLQKLRPVLFGKRADRPAASKTFFFEKKKQKTFAKLDRAGLIAWGSVHQKFFGYFFSKK
jgi:GT2 family glycosyltransferase